MIVQMLKNKGVSQDTPFLCNQYENQVAEITVNLPEEYVNTAYFYYMICESPNSATPEFAVPLLLEIDPVTLLPLNKVKYIVGSNISWTAGNWEFCLLIKSVEMVNGAVGADGIVAVSEYFTGKIKSGIIDTDALAEQPADPNIVIVYDTMIAAVAAEQTRVIAENTRVSNEQTRESNEISRESAETLRISAEEARATEEGNRVTAESNRNIAENARVIAENARAVCEAYNTATAYVVGNKVTYNGSTYQCILNSTGNLPTNATYWILIAAKGADGIGAGDMLASVYDTNNSGTVDDSDKLGGQLPEYFAKQDDLGDKTTLTTEAKTNLVAAINEHEAQINSLAADVAAHKSEVVSHTQRVIRDLSLTGIQHITLPFKANSIAINAYLYPTKAMSWGQYAQGQQHVMKIQFDGLSNSAVGTAISLFVSSGNEANGYIENVTDIGFDINWSKIGSPTGSCDLFILAQTH